MSRAAVTTREQPAATPVVEYQSVSKRFALRGTEVHAVDDVRLAIPPNQTTAIVGPSGCGKTTLLSLCAGFEPPSSGTTLYQGRRVDGINVGVGYITQEASLYPWMTLQQNVEFPLEILGVGAAERHERSAAYLDLVGLSGFEQHFPHQLSGGMRHRGSIIRTMIYEPDVILMDEPFASLDMPTRLTLQDELLKLLEQRPKTVIFVTHDITEAVTLSDTIVVMSKRPATIKQVVDVPLPRPRDVFHIMRQDGFAEIYDQVWDVLQGEFGEPSTDGGRASAVQLPPPLAVTGRRARRAAGPDGGGVRGPAPDAPPTAPRRAATRRRLTSPPAINLYRLLFAVGVLGLWQLLADLGVLNPLLFSSPLEVGERLVRLLAGQDAFGRTIYDHVLTTLQEMAIGYVIGAVVGLVLGFAFGRSELLSKVLEPFVLAVYSVPKIALAPLFVLFLGIGLASKVGVVVMELFFLVFFNTFSGVRNINEDHVRLAQVVGASRSQVLRRVVFPAATPAILLGLKMGIPFAMIGAIIGEFMAANQGLGWFILYSASNFDASGLFAAILILVAVVWALSQAMQTLEGRLLSWRPARGDTAVLT